MLLQLTLSPKETNHARFHDLILSAAKSWSRVEVHADGHRVPVQWFPEVESRWALVTLYSRGDPVKVTESSVEAEVSARYSAEGVVDPSSRLRVSVTDDGVTVFTDHLSTVPSFVAAGEVLGLVMWPGALEARSVLRSPPRSVLRLRPDSVSSVTEGLPEPGETATGTAQGLLEAIEDSVVRNVGDRCAVGLSGGLDSGLILKLVAERKRGAVAVTVGVRGSEDLERARRVAEKLGVDHVAHELSEEEVVAAAAYVRRAMGLKSPMCVSLGVINHVCASLAKSLGRTQLVVGQGADELFGGYAKYVGALEEGGYQALDSAMRSDLRELWRQGIVRDYVSAALGGVTLTAPYLDPRVVELARAAPAELKVRGSERKVLLRGAARLASVPEEVWRAEKRAAQYSTGVEKVVRRWLRRTV